MSNGFTISPKHITIERAPAPCWRAVEVRYFDANQHQGNESRNIYVRGELADGSPAYGVVIEQTWTAMDDKPPRRALTTVTSEEIEGDPRDGTAIAGTDFPMSKDGRRPAQDEPGPYAVQAVGAGASDKVSGFGLDPNWGHSAYRVFFRHVESDAPAPPTPAPSDPSALDKAIAAAEAVLAYLKSLQ